MTTPFRTKIRGRVRLHPRALVADAADFGTVGRHFWRPIAPVARVEVELERPALRWSGPGYLDTNWGDEPLEDGFRYWNWSRSSMACGTAVLYDVVRRGGERLSMAIQYDHSGTAQPFAPPPPARLPATLWRIERATRNDGSGPASVMKTLEDGPFYTRGLISTGLLGERVTAIHESLSLDRFRARWVQTLLPYRMPRVAPR